MGASCGRLRVCLGAFGQVIATFLGKCLALNNFRRQLGSDLRGIKEAEVPLRTLMRKYRQG